MAGIAENRGMHAVKIDGVEDHVYRVDQLGGELGIIKAVQLIKSDSSRWMNELRHRFFLHKAELSSFLIRAFNWFFQADMADTGPTGKS